MKDEVLKYNLTKNDVEGSTVFLPSIKVNNKRVVDSGTIEANTTNTYTLKMWMDYDTTNEAMNKIFSAKLNVRAEQENIKVDENQIVMDINDTTKNLNLEEDISNYEIESSDEEVAVVNSLGNIEGRHQGTVIFKTTNKNTGAKKNITVTITKTLTVKFIKQTGVNTISKEEESCILKDKNEENCSVVAPNITEQDGYTFIGWNTDKTSTTGILQNTEIELSDNQKFYTIVKKDAITLSATFNKNGATLLDENTNEEITKTCVIEEVYNDEEQKTSCNITTPNIVASQETPTVCGYTTTSDGTSTCEVKANQKLTITKNVKYYAQTYKSAVTNTIIWSSNGATIGATASSCTLEATYNGVAQAIGCNITSPTITRTGYTIYGWNTDKDATTSTWNVGVEKQISNSATYYAITKDTTAPSCGNWSGESTTWKNGSRTISVGCTDSGSGCKQSTYSKTFTSSTTTSNVSLTISDNAGNTRVCSKTANVYLDTAAPSTPTLYRGYQLFGNENNASISYENINASAANTYIVINSTNGDPQIVMTPRFALGNVIGYIQSINPKNNKLFYQVFYNSNGTSASESNSASRWISAINSNRWEYLSFGKTISLAANNSLIRVDIGTSAGLQYYLSGGFVVAAKNQSEPGGANYLILSTVPSDTGGSGINHVECNYNNNGYTRLADYDSQGQFLIYDLPVSGSANGKVTYCRAVDNAGNVSGASSVTLYVTG